MEATRSLSSALTDDIAQELDGLLASGSAHEAVSVAQRVLRHPHAAGLSRHVIGRAARVLLDAGFPFALELTPEELALARAGEPVAEPSGFHAMATAFSFVICVLALIFSVASLMPFVIAAGAGLFGPLGAACFFSIKDARRPRRIALGLASLPLLALGVITYLGVAEGGFHGQALFIASLVCMPAWLSLLCAVLPQKRG